jgi:hypothetical protein
MSWDQEYHVQSYLELLIKLTGKHPEELLEKCLLDGPHPYVASKEEVVLDDGFYGPIKGIKVTLSDGTVWIPKLTQKFEENGNHGIDIYEYVLEQENPQIQYIGLDPAEEGTDETVTAEQDPCTGDHCHCDSDRFCTPDCYIGQCNDGGCGCGD